MPQLMAIRRSLIPQDHFMRNTSLIFLMDNLLVDIAPPVPFWREDNALVDCPAGLHLQLLTGWPIRVGTGGRLTS
jgi:hypothetical protein